MDAKIKEKAWRLAILHDRIQYLKNEIDKIDAEKKQLIRQIIEALGDQVQKNNLFDFPDQDKSVNLKRFDRKILHPEILSILAKIRTDAIASMKYTPASYYALYVTSFKNCDSGLEDTVESEQGQQQQATPSSENAMEDEERGSMKWERAGIQPRVRNTIAKPFDEDSCVFDAKEMNAFKALKHWRFQRASAQGFAPYMIAHDKWLKQMIKERVHEMGDFRKIKGFGEARATKYGNEIIDIITKYLS